MVGSTTVKLPFPIKVGGLYFNKNRLLSFDFDNYAMFLYMRSKPELEFKFDKLRKHIESNQSIYLVEMLYYSHLSFHAKRYVKPRCATLKQMAHCIGNAKPEAIKELTDTLKDSEVFGGKASPGGGDASKKKV